MERHTNYLKESFGLPDINLKDLAICFSTKKRAIDLNVCSNKAYAVIGDKFLDAVLFDYKFMLNNNLTAENLDDFRQVTTDNKNHQETMKRNKLAQYVMVGPRKNNITTIAGRDNLAATFEALVYVVYKNFGILVLLHFLKKIYSV